MNRRDPPTYRFVEPSILFQQDIVLKRNKRQENLPAVDRGRVNLKVIRDASGASFRFVAHSPLTGALFLNASPLPSRPLIHSKLENTVVLYLADFSSHANLKRIFYFKFISSDSVHQFVETVEPLYDKLLMGRSNTRDDADDFSEDSFAPGDDGDEAPTDRHNHNGGDDKNNCKDSDDEESCDDGGDYGEVGSDDDGSIGRGANDDGSVGRGAYDDGSAGRGANDDDSVGSGANDDTDHIHVYDDDDDNHETQLWPETPFVIVPPKRF